MDYFATENVFGEFCENMFKHDVKAVYHERFLGSEGKDVN